MADNTLDVLTQILNGNLQVGIAASSDVPDDTAAVVDILQTGNVTAKAKYAAWSVKDVEAGSPALNKIFIHMAASVAACGNSCADAGTNGIRTRKITEPDNAFEPADVELDPKLLLSGMTIALSFKVNWWQANHHMGGNVLSGFAKKCLKAIEPNVETLFRDPKISSIWWTAAHWLDTRRAMAMLGIINVDGVIRLNLGHDIAMRVKSHPAGAAAAYICAAILNTYGDHVCFKLISRDPCLARDAIEIMDAHDDIMANPVAYHVGVTYLDSSIERKTYVPPDRMISALATLVTALNPDSSILQSPTIKRAAIDRTLAVSMRQAIDKTQNDSTLGPSLNDLRTASAVDASL